MQSSRENVKGFVHVATVYHILNNYKMYIYVYKHFMEKQFNIKYICYKRVRI